MASVQQRDACDWSTFKSNHRKIASKKLLVNSVKLNQIFQSATPTKQPHHTTTHGGRIRLFRRPDSSHWQCRFRLDNGTWHQATTSTTVFNEAETRAIAIYETVRVRVSNDLAIRTKSFQRVAAEEVEALRHARSGLLTKQTTGDYIFVIERYLIPFFGDRKSTRLNSSHVSESRMPSSA